LKILGNLEYGEIWPGSSLHLVARKINFQQKQTKI
jgi:hypothetical protein